MTGPIYMFSRRTPGVRLEFGIAGEWSSFLHMSAYQNRFLSPIFSPRLMYVLIAVHVIQDDAGQLAWSVQRTRLLQRHQRAELTYWLHNIYRKSQSVFLETRLLRIYTTPQCVWSTRHVDFQGIPCEVTKHATCDSATWLPA